MLSPINQWKASIPGLPRDRPVSVRHRRVIIIIVHPTVLSNYDSVNMKAARACPQCRESKRKCIRAGPGEPCASCHQRELNCGGRLLPSTAATSRKEKEKEKKRKDTTVTPNLPWETIVELVEIYLDKLHDRPHSIFHPATLRAQLRDRSLCGTLLYSICAVASKFSSDGERHDLEITMAAEAKRRLKADLENVCIENIQACILLSTLSAGNCETSSAALFTRKTFFLPQPASKLMIWSRDCYKYG